MTVHFYGEKERLAFGEIYCDDSKADLVTSLIEAAALSSRLDDDDLYHEPACC